MLKLPEHPDFKRLAMVACLCSFLMSAYLLTYSGVVNSGDELFIIDTTHALATRGDLLLTQTVYERGLQLSDVELAQPLLAAPLYWAAYHTPWLGNVHALFLFNPLVTALTVGVFFYYVLMLGYSERTALIASLLLGLTTIMWPYTKTFFREPLTMLVALSTAYCLARWQQAFTLRKKHWGWLAGGLALLGIGLFSKEATWLLVLPFLLLAYPDAAALHLSRRQLLIIGGLAVGMLVLLGVAVTWYDTLLGTDTGRYDLVAQFVAIPKRIPWMWPGFIGYLISPGKSVWMYSPVLIFALAAPWLLPRERWRESWLPLGILLIFAAAYGIVRGPLWHGGVGWGPRYMMPITPLVMIAALPGIDRALNGKSLPLKIALGLLALAGFAIQVGGAIVRLSDYYDYMQAVTGSAAWLGPGIWHPRWSQAVGTLLYLPLARPDTAWFQPDADMVSMGVLIGAAVALFGMLTWQLSRSGCANWADVVLFFSGPLIVTGCGLIALARLWDDPRYLGGRQALHTAVEAFSAQAHPQSQLLLNAPSYAWFMMNYYKADSTWIGLPLSPGERYSCEQVPEVTSPDLQEQMHPVAMNTTNSLVSGVIQTDQPIWLLGDRGPFGPCNTRPVERYLSTLTYPVSTQDFELDVRLTQFLPIYAPGTFMNEQDRPAYRPNLRFGRSIRLAGYDLTLYGGAQPEDGLGPGDMLGVSLQWRAIRPVTEDYTVGVYILDAAGQVIAQRDSQPAGGFAPTSGWAVGQEIRDNHGLILPPDAQGPFEVWVVLYQWPSLERLELATGDDHIVLGRFPAR